MMVIDPPVLLLIVAAPFVGSFLAVLADRLPRDEDVVRAPSACRACGARLGFRDLVPLLAFLFRAGRCRHCGAAIPPWLLYMEIIATGLAILAVVAWPEAAMAWAAAVLWWILLALIASDLGHFRLPDVLTGALLIWALALSLTGLGPVPPQALMGAVIGAGSFWVLRWVYGRVRGREGLGLGDVKLMAGLGAMVGPWDLPLMVLWAALAGLAVAAVAHLRGQATAAQADTPLPFGAALALAGGLLWAVRQMPV